MDNIILAVSLLSFFALMVAWMALPASTPTPVIVKQVVGANASA